VLALAAGRAQAQGGPPFITDDPATPGANRWEINLAAALELLPGEYLLRAPVLDANLGVGDRLQLKYETAWTTAGVSGEETTSALGNSIAGVKARFLDRLRDGAPVDVSVYPQLAFNPVSSEEVGPIERDTVLILPVEAAFSLGPIDLAAEAGYQAVLGEPHRLMGGVVAAHTFAGRLTIGGDLHYEADIDLAADQLVLVVGAVVALVHGHNLLVSVGRVPRASESGQPDLVGYLGLQLHL
jgi:hypothetical protein